MQMYYIFFMDRGHSMMFNLNIETTSFQALIEIVANEVGHKVSDLILLDELGASPDGSKFLYQSETVGTSTSPVFLYLKSGTDQYNAHNSDVTYIFQMMDDALEQAQHVLKSREPEKIYMELPERAKTCRKVTTECLQACATLVEQHRLLHKGWLALINNLDTSVVKMDKRGKRFRSINLKMEEVIARADSLLENYDDVIEQLRRIEVPSEVFVKPAPLMASTASPNAFEDKCTLYDFISRADPEASLEDLPELVNEKLEQLKEQDVAGIYDKLQKANEQSKNPEFREFKGINKRFSQLEFSLKSCEERKNIVHKLVAKILETPKEISEKELPSIVDHHRRYMTVIFENFTEFRNMVKVFEQSKNEILKNLSTRMAGFVVQSYDRLRTVNNDIIQYEYKGDAVRIHMDLIGQIRDAPILYSQSVSEIVRRRLLKTELDDWHTDHSTKCSQFSTDEDKSREQLGRKLKKHFLHALFPGLFDKLPTFFVKSPLAKFDTDLPNIAKEYIKELRDAVPELEPYLKVTVPNVSGKLATKGVKPHPPFGQGRVESFLTEEPMRMARSHFNYSPAAWLSEDGGDSSPIPQALMCRSPDNLLRESQCKSIPYVPSLQQLEGLDGPIPCSSTPQSAPISIPNSMSNRVNFKQSSRRLSSQDLPPVGSAVSSDTSLLGPETPVRTTEMTLLQNNATQLDESSSSGSIDSLFDVYESLDFAASDILVGVSDDSSQLEDVVKRLSKMQDFTANMPQRNEKLYKYLHQTAPRDLKLIIHDADQLKTCVKNMGEKVENLEMELEAKKKLLTDVEAQLDTLKTDHKKELDESQAECIKKMSVEFELMTDSMSKQNKELLENKNREIEELKAKLEKQTVATEKAMLSDPYTEEYKKTLTAEIRNELEKEFKGRIEVITKAVECKKDEAFARQQKTLDIENRVLSTENESKSKKLEAMSHEIEELEALIRQMPDGATILDEFNALKETHPTSKLEEQVAAIRARMEKASHNLDNDKLLYIDNILKVHKIEQLVAIIAECREFAESKAGGQEALKALNEFLKSEPVDVAVYKKELDQPNSSDKAGRKISKIVELQFELVWIQALLRNLPNGQMSASFYRPQLNVEEQDVETVTFISMMDIFIDHDREEVKKVAKTMQSWLNSYSQSVTISGGFAISECPTVREIASRFVQPAPHISVMMDESFNHQMAASTIFIPNSPSALDLEVERTTSNTISTQTRLCMANMNMLVSIQDIKVGSIVFVVWNTSRNAYAVFCATPSRYFVKESTIRRLGIKVDDAATRRNWILARVIDSETCSIKKPSNRYNLPVDTIVRRVDIELMTLNFSGCYN